ncbi:FGGY-family carbohydrate kinase [Niabella drilacis]|uniref:Autoinducer 2 (AI-2) kinase n=1 Tax=Niabella drilacis (strain DSM 25811 / CCM 8410 / CCUG 62505 / LMG 26954 / E90) TaxID=1285928 RepID=A0A1G6HYN2_NIADE|nr:FGGY family carbohydrate kinase [Niabella drilacis]SDB98935.1 autoinducer 2 (AI-2) kinase [Niabella drilacis]
MALTNAHLIIDFGTGNLRAAVISVNGAVLGVAREDIPYIRDTQYEDSIYFDPQVLWGRILELTAIALKQAGSVRILAITATSQREGIVVLDPAGTPVVGMPNIDHRGRNREPVISDKEQVYRLAGRYPGSLFSAFKLVGLREGRKEWWNQLDTFLSISDWIEYMFCGVEHYEHSQASETLLYDVAQQTWSETLCALFSFPLSLLPPLTRSGTVLGKIRPPLAEALSIDADAKVIVGGADTQLAVLSTRAHAGDVVIVSGTTTPIIKLSASYDLDEQQRTWTGRYIDANSYMVEANAGVTGLNYQRLKKIFYPNEGYEVIEEELRSVTDFQCVASLGSLVADEKKPLIKGGFIFNTPVNHELSRAGMVWATLWDIACSIFENYKTLVSVTPNAHSYIWTCGGGMESRMLRQFIADLTGKEIRIRDNYRHASVIGGMMICNTALGITAGQKELYEAVQPEAGTQPSLFYNSWKEHRELLKKIF